MRILITGGNGFIGSHLVEELSKTTRNEVFCLIRKTSDLTWLQGLDVRLVEGDILNKESLYRALKGMDYIYHIAGITKAQHPATYFQVNHIGTKNLIEACAETNPDVKKFVYLSSQAAMGPSKNGYAITENDACNPITYYGKSKLLGETEVLKFVSRLPLTIIRASAIYGPKDRDIYIYFKWLNHGIKPFISGGERYLNLCYVKDLATALILACNENKSTGEIFLISENKVYTWTEISDIIEKILGCSAKRIVIPEYLLYLITTWGELIGRIRGKSVLLSKQKYLEVIQKYWTCDVSKAEKVLGFSTSFSLEEGIRKTVEWYKKMNWL